MSDRQTVLYACIHNSGRSVAAEALTRHHAGDAVEVRSAGSEPGAGVNPVVAQVLAERGLPVTGHVPTRLDAELVQAADVVVTMGCGETCPVFPGKRYEDWPVADPAGQDLETVRRIVDDIDARVRALLSDLEDERCQLAEAEEVGMNAAGLRELQRPLKQRYRDDPDAAQTPMHAHADFSDPGITTTVRTWAGPVRAGFHPATGGDGSDACSGDMLLEALVACTGVTLRSVATAMGVVIRGAHLDGRAVMDARGTLGVSGEAPVGLQAIEVDVAVDTDADDAALTRLAQLTERYCVVAQTLAERPRLTVRRAAGR